MDLDKKIEAILFFKGEPVSHAFLAEATGAEEGEVKKAVERLRESLRERGVRVLEKESEVMLGTAPECSDLIEEMVKEELNKDLGRAGRETLAVVLYLGPVTRARIDYIRGVNSTFILRNLSVRGLVERVQNPDDQRSFLYKPTFELLSHLGVANVEELPGYEKVRADIAAFEESANSESNTNMTNENTKND